MTATIMFITRNHDSVIDHSSCIVPVKNGNTVEIRPLTTDHMFKCFVRLNVSAAPGLDGVTCRHLKLGKLIIVPKICKLFNRIIATGVIPTSWKQEKIVAIYKGAGSVKDPSTHNTAIVYF